MSLVVCREGMSRTRASVRIGAGRYVSTDRMTQAVQDRRIVVRRMLVCQLVREGWTYDSPDRRMLVDSLMP